MPKINITLDTYNQLVLLNGATRIDVQPETIMSLTKAVERQAIAESASAGLAPRPSSTSQAPTSSLLKMGTTLSKAPSNGISDSSDIPAMGQLSDVQSDIAKYLSDE